MRLKVSFTCKIIPLSYRFMFVSFIKEALKTSNAVYAENLYVFENKPNKKARILRFRNRGIDTYHQAMNFL
ncbi:hypothetical protein [Bacillus sp. FJAT-51639]